MRNYVYYYRHRRVRLRVRPTVVIILFSKFSLGFLCRHRSLWFIEQYYNILFVVSCALWSILATAGKTSCKRPEAAAAFKVQNDGTASPTWLETDFGLQRYNSCISSVLTAAAPDALTDLGVKILDNKKRNRWCLL